MNHGGAKRVEWSDSVRSRMHADGVARDSGVSHNGVADHGIVVYKEEPYKV